MCGKPRCLRGCQWERLQKNGVTWTLIVLLIAAASVDYVLYTRFTKETQLYALPIMQVVYPLAFCVIIWSMLVVQWLWQCCRERTAIHRGEYGRATGGMSGFTRNHALCCGRYTGMRTMWPSYVLIAFLDSLGNILEFVPLIYLNSALLVIVGQIHVPIMLVFSSLYLARRYRGSHYLGVLLVILGIAVALAPSIDTWLLAPSAALPPFNATNGTNGTLGSNGPASPGAAPAVPPQQILLWVGVFVLGAIPHGFSRVYTERLMKRYNVDPARMLAGTSPFQLLMSLPMIFVPMLPLPAPAPHVAPARFGAFLFQSGACLLGRTPADPIVLAGTADLHLDCTHAPVVFTFFIVFNLAFNLLSLALTRRTTANTTTISSVMRLGLSSLLFMVPWLAGAATHTMVRMDVLALVIIAIGILVFRYRTEILNAAREEPHPDYFYSRRQMEAELQDGFFHSSSSGEEGRGEKAGGVRLDTQLEYSSGNGLSDDDDLEFELDDSSEGHQ